MLNESKCILTYSMNTCFIVISSLNIMIQWQFPSYSKQLIIIIITDKLFSFLY